MADDFKWNGKELERLVVVHIGKNMAAACFVLVNHLKQLVNVEGAGLKGKSLSYGANPSAPGDPPHKQTGRLLGSITFEISNLVARVGTNVKYGRWLELGTKYIKARPWLRRGLFEMRAAIAKLIGKPM